MGIFDGCLLACDIDGTLMENGYINPKNIEKIEYFMSQGGIFSISTGRSVGAISSVTSKLIRISPSVVANGCMIYDYENEKILYQQFIPDTDRLFAKHVYDSGLPFGIEVHSQDRVFTLRRNKESDDHQHYENLETTVVSYEDISDLKWNKVLFALNCKEDYEILNKLCDSQKHSSNFIETCVYLDKKTRYYYEQIPLGVSKATAINELCKIFNIKQGCSYAIGDYYNDIEMLKNADICAVLCGAPDDIKSLADYITVSCDDGAVANFIDYLIKIHNKL